MKKQIRAVQTFHTAFGLGFAKNPIATLGEQKNNLRFNLMAEENNEYLQAAQNKDIIQVADALGDMLYVLCGTIIEHGLQDIITNIFDEIQKSNMSKLDNNGKVIHREDGKVLKGSNYCKPDIAQFFKPKSTK